MLPNLKLLRREYGVSQPSINKYENHNIEPERYRSLSEDQKSCIDLTMRTFLKK